jgi:Spy/CpxP family protein refolding chaperone
MRMLTTIFALFVMLSAASQAQTADASAKPLTDSDIQLLRSNVQADKNTIIAHTMQFTDAESGAFWPLYRDYARDQQVIGDERVQLIKDYALNYDSMDDPKAKDMVQRMINIEDETLNLREDYWPKFMKALGAKRAAKFYQVDARLSLIVTVQLTSAIPLIP